MNDVRGQETEQSVAPVAPRRTPFLGVGLALILTAAAFFSGLHIGSDSSFDANVRSIFASPARSEENVDLSTFWRVWEVLDQRFVASTSTDPLTDEERVWQAAQGLVDSYGDPYTVFLPPEDAEIFEEDISGNFEGVGMEIGIRNDVLTVIAPLPDSPAERAGILAGDAVIRIDGDSTDSFSIDEAVKRIRGEKGTEVTLTIFREGEEELLEISVVRDRIDIPTITTERRDGVFIVRLFNFSALSEAKMQEALREFVANREEKLIIDLRGNPGGFLQSAVNIASYFLPTGKVVVREDFGDDREEELYRSSGRTLRSFAPEEVVVLVDGGSASASEILAGALQEHDVAIVIGSQTFGKGSVQELVELRDGSSLKVTIARWLTPDGTSISDGGLTPDIEVEVTREDREAGIDPQLDAAIEFLNRDNE